MANQFSAKILFTAITWRAYDQETGAQAIVSDNNVDYDWVVRAPDSGKDQHNYPLVKRGICKTSAGARAAVRRVIATLPKYWKKKK